MKSILLISVVAILQLQSVYSEKPNIVYILADDLGYNELGCYGQDKIETPNIDALAASGIRFTQHYSGSPVCAPSRCVLMTGKHTGHAYIRGNTNGGSVETLGISRRRSKIRIWRVSARFQSEPKRLVPCCRELDTKRPLSVNGDWVRPLRIVSQPRWDLTFSTGTTVSARRILSIPNTFGKMKKRIGWKTN